MLQPDFLAETVNICREEEVHTAVDTAGHVPYEWLVRVNPDLFLYDIKAVSPDKHMSLTGADGILIWENLRRLLADGYNVKVRVPCVPGANWDELPAIGERLREWGVADIEALPYHRLGEGKAAWYGQKLRVFDSPSEVEMEEAIKLLKGW
jgi:pyruvate formate lyase activating enzyme